MTSAQLVQAPWIPEVVEQLAHELRAHHAPTAEHSRRLALLSRAVAERLGLGAQEAAEVEVVAVLHDVGKLAIDRELLDWPGQLSDEQLTRMRRHTIEGEELLTGIAGLSHLARAVRATHEAWDGTGYPDGLRGTAIPLTARIVSTVDAFDAMVSDRSYRCALPVREARRRIRGAAGVQFDPIVVDALLAARAA